MRLVMTETDLDDAVLSARREAQASFGDGTVFAERWLAAPRHVEIQIVADKHGHFLHLGERECSIQRRHQKIIEEAPSPAVDEFLREQLGAAAIRLAQEINYDSVGTVEFLLDADRGEFFFLEMNTRLQVEHPVTEEVWGVDLAATMIRIALGEKLPFDAAGLTPRGHAIECRVYAEDPLRGFAPSPGSISALRLPQGPGVRNDVGVEAGSVVPIDYDPMLGKLIVHAPDRPLAIARLSRALAEYEIGGVETTLPLFRALAADPQFVRGDFDVQWLDRKLASGLFPATSPGEDEVWLAAAGLAAAEASAVPAASVAPTSLWRADARRQAQRD
jgi:acetyl/propionyl-CoA carboxylase alpha subunit